MSGAIIRGSLYAFLFGVSQLIAGPVKPYIINGQEVPAGSYLEVVKVTSETGETCGATIIGPRTIVTAAHCVKNSKTMTFETSSRTKFTADMTKSTLYPNKNHDLALGYVKSGDITTDFKQMATVGGSATTGLQLTLLGYGCTRPDVPAGDGKLRYGNTAILGTDSYQIKSGGTGGAILCIGDSGGPTFVESNGKRQLIGVNAQGNMTSSNYSSRLDIPDSTSFLTTFANANNTKICGIAGYTCDGPPNPVDPSCTLKAVPNPIHLGDSLTLNLTTTNAVSAKINGQTATVPNDQKSITPTQDGTFTAIAEVTSSSGKTAQCQDTYTVSKTPPPPSNEPPKCTMTATPDVAYQNEIVTLEIHTEGDVEYASIDGTPVQFPMGRKLVTAKGEGDFSSRGFARGKGGSVNCFADYKVLKGARPPVPPDFAAVPAYCGDNTAGTDIKRVCWAVVKKPAKLKSIRTPYAILITNKDDSQEVLPIASRTPQPAAPGATEVTEDLNLLSGKTVPTPDTLVFDTLPAKLTRKATSSPDTVEPLTLSGKSIKKLDFAATLTALGPEKAKRRKHGSR